MKHVPFELARRLSVSGRCAVSTVGLAVLAVLPGWSLSYGQQGLNRDRLQASTRPELPVIHVARLEPAVATQFREVRATVDAVLGRQEADPDSLATAYGNYARLLHAYGYFAEAVACYQAAIALQPGEPAWRHLCACAAESGGDLDLARTEFQSTLVLAPQYTATRIRLGRVMLLSNDLDAASDLFDSLLVDRPELPAAHAGRGETALAKKDYRTAVVHFEQVLAQVPRASRYHYSLAMAYRGLGDVTRAREHLQQRGDIGLKPEDPWLDEVDDLRRGENVHVLRARMAFAAGAVGDAIREYRRALMFNPDCLPARINLAAALAGTGERDEAIEHLAAALKLAPANTNALYNAAALRTARADPDQNDLVEAESLLRRLHDLSPNDHVALEALGRLL
ncbi:MAG: tetratricopeptide repeat protein, partial [Planctomycetaceae bacterium]|nr:tetratricopeptide repeat protein [Planctomycetaceae bacterium]